VSLFYLPHAFVSVSGRYTLGFDERFLSRFKRFFIFPRFNVFMFLKNDGGDISPSTFKRGGVLSRVHIALADLISSHLI